MEWHDVLGVGPSASESEIVAAYRHLAKLLHPDTVATADAATRRLRQIQMARLNEAYREARTAGPARIQTQPARVALDERQSPSLRNEAPARITDGVSPAPTAARPADSEDEALPVPVTGRGRRWGWRVVGVAVAIAVVLGALMGRSSQAPPGPMVDTCVVWSGGYHTSPCGQPHTGLVVEAVSAAAECPSRSAYMATSSRILCIDTSR